MGIFDKLFGGSSHEEDQPVIRFGRYTDSYKSDQQYDSWDEALDHFKEKEYKQSILLFLQYLKDQNEGNVNFSENEGQIDFELFQGSKKIKGFATDKKVKAEVKVAKTETLNLGFMRRIMEQNFTMRYGRYALDDQDDISILFDTYILDGSPYKLYYALKEIATKADKQDDLLLDEFDESLQQIDSGHVEDLSVAEKTIKRDFLNSEIKSVFQTIDSNKLDATKYPGGIGYLLLYLSYKLDYLVKPEGFMMETFEGVHRTYFANTGKSTNQKNNAIRKEFEKLLEREEEELFKELYNVKCTFGITNPVNHDQVVAFIDGELNNMDWYLENDHYEIALSIPGYIVGYCLFNYAIPKPDRDFFHLYFRIIEEKYFKALGFNQSFQDENGLPSRREIRRAIDRLVDLNERKFPNLEAKMNLLNYDSLPKFAKSYLLMMKEFNLSKPH